MTTLPPEERFSQSGHERARQSVEMAAPAGHQRDKSLEGSRAEWQPHLQRLICELLIENQQLRMALMQRRLVGVGDDDGFSE